MVARWVMAQLFSCFREIQAKKAQPGQVLGLGGGGGVKAVACALPSTSGEHQALKVLPSAASLASTGAGFQKEASSSGFLA
jgi:hypothetical protein